MEEDNIYKKRLRESFESIYAMGQKHTKIGTYLVLKYVTNLA